MKNSALDSLIVTVANATVHIVNYVVVAGSDALQDSSRRRQGNDWQADNKKK
jgi:hypothetical protein